MVDADQQVAARATRSPTGRRTSRSSRNTRSSGSITRQRTATSTSRPSRPASDVGGAVLQVPGAEPLDDVGGLARWAMACRFDRRAACASKNRWSSTSRAKPRADDHAGNVDAAQYRLPIKIFILKQPVHGDGAAVAGAAAWRALFGELFGSAAGLRQARRGLSRRRHPLAKKPGDLDHAIKEMINVDKPVLFDCFVDQNENCFR